jgi:8-oxo-dGTP pyrophosphatase MutT (NUDIX family)
VRRLRDPLLRLAFRVGYRVLRVWWFVRRPTTRGVKCVLTCGDEILLVRHTYGRTDRWELPGGGVKRREEPRAAARREVREEVGVDLGGLEPLGELFRRVDSKHDRLWCFAAEVDSHEVERDPAEIAECRWFPRDALPDERAKYVERIVALADAETPAERHRKLPH